MSGTIVLIFVIFHLANHLAGLGGSGVHKSIMEMGREVYRAPWIEALLVFAMLFQVGSGLYLAWQWSSVKSDFHRVFQVASGCYLSLFILGHMNSVFIFARIHLQIPTDWSFATGAPAGLLHDAWNVRLVPHYALGVFFVLTHLISGLRVVLATHGVNNIVLNRVWFSGMALAGVIAVAIIAGMCGLRIPVDLSS